MQKKYLIPIGGIGLVLILSVIYLVSPKAPKEAGEPVQRGVLPIASGKQTYTVLTDKPSDFQITQVDLDPLNVQMNQTQTITVYVKDKENHPITKRTGVAGVIHTDNGKTKVEFALKQADGPPSLTKWQGTWTLQDTINKQYMATISAFADFGKSSTDLSFR